MGRCSLAEGRPMPCRSQSKIEPLPLVQRVRSSGGRSGTRPNWRRKNTVSLGKVQWIELVEAIRAGNLAAIP
jgi:hypothetical protein